MFKTKLLTHTKLIKHLVHSGCNPIIQYVKRPKKIGGTILCGTRSHIRFERRYTQDL